MSKRIEELRANDCRWPVGDKSEVPYDFCACPIKVGAYCEKHFKESVRLNYKTLRERSKKDMERLAKVVQ